VVKLLREEREWRRFFGMCCKDGVSRLWSSSYQFRDELQTRGEWCEPEEIGDVLLSLARKKLPESPAARWDAEWASRLSREALERLAGHYASLITEDECVRLSLEAQDDWHDRMNVAGEENDPTAFREALAGWERVGLETFEDARSKKGAVA
jgi:hypothetical protein